MPSAKSMLRAVTPAPLWRLAVLLRARMAAIRGKLSYSAHGEDLLVVSWLRHYQCDLSKVRYVDVGANHPIFLSNTYLLYRAGARGLLIEPDPAQAALLRAGRPNDVVVCAGVAFDERRSATLFRMTASGFNTFSRKQAEFVICSSQSWEPHEQQLIVEEITVPLVPLNDVITEHLPGGAPDFISIDTEGADL